MKIFDTQYLDERMMKKLSADEAANIYNGLDCCVTSEIYNELMAQLDTEPPNIRATYELALAKLAPIMEMSLRGTAIDEGARKATITSMQRTLTNLDAKFQRIMQEVFDIPHVNWQSHVQLKILFYDILRLKVVKKRNAQGIFAPTVNAAALESFVGFYLHAGLLARFILVMRDLAKSISFLKTEVDPDRRMRCNYNIAGTNTGRLSSSMNDFGTGTNLQNVDRSLRYPFVADPGMYLVNIDLEQADARNVGAIIWNLFYESHGAEFAGAYLDACESGDLHTQVCRMVWPDLDWPADPALWKKYCDTEIAHGQDTYRQLAKKGGHGTNYYGTPRTMAKHLHVSQKVVESFQKRYFGAFPAIPIWHKHVIQKISTTGTLTTLFGRRRMFFGRGKEATTHRKAIAFEPQSCTGEQIDRGLLQIWRHFDPSKVQLLNQVHDSILLQVPFAEAETLIPEILRVMEVPLTLAGGRRFVVPLDAKAGWNWGDFDPANPNKNPHGLSKWTGQETRNRPSVRLRLKDYL